MIHLIIENKRETRVVECQSMKNAMLILESSSKWRNRHVEGVWNYLKSACDDAADAIMTGTAQAAKELSR